MTDSKVNKSLVTVISVWNGIIFADTMYHLDIYTADADPIPVEQGSRMKDTVTPSN